VHGSRVRGAVDVKTGLPKTPRPDSDIDLILRVNSDTFEKLVDEAKAHIPKLNSEMVRQINQKALGRFVLGARGWHPNFHSTFYDDFVNPLNLPFQVDFSVVQMGSKLDTGPFIQIGR
jgi:hypothetical protein